ncbi:toprim domain-containing protein [Bradyrhizobium xenonodulans]|uniref:Toprim domain-containing protein n=1 Tax=Bradyrhizobium xenonodulans TaxID=2736875 RepID=A0ABY7MV83_9BRAD|nr:toprim domain-containing protein [Bradyrhizobium xenonodulans]WBL82305.1 toprim domain-containing protein [Bradyrhizobium xenonodulans]
MVMTTPLHERARGRWQTILPALGMDRRFLKRKNGPCPMCGGKDRWRFTDIEGKGTWWCNRCQGGNGVALALKFTKLSFRDVAAHIERVLGDAPIDTARRQRSDQENRAALNALWCSGRAVIPGDPVDLWITGRGLRLDSYPRALRTCQRARHSGPPVTWHPAMLAMVTDPAGKASTIHKTYITTGGKKAAVDRVRMFCPGSRPPGGAVRLTPPAPVLGIAEGIETAIACTMLFDVPTWSALDAGGVERFEPPVGTERLVIFGDHDANGTGQRAAYALASRMAGRVEIDVRLPPETGTDWNDVLLG